MKKVVIFTEGLTESIFICHLLGTIYNNCFLSYEYIDLNGKNKLPGFLNKEAYIDFQIYDAGCDEGVLAKIKEREKKLFKKGVKLIIGIRDMYSGRYLKLSNNINSATIRKLIDEANFEISEMSDSSRIKFHFSIMEIEAWFLAMYKIFKKINSILSVEYIKEKLGFDLLNCDPEKEFFHPSENLDKILKLCNMNLKYNKSKRIIFKIVSKISLKMIEEVFERNICSTFKGFDKEIKNLIGITCINNASNKQFKN